MLIRLPRSRSRQALKALIAPLAAAVSVEERARHDLVSVVGHAGAAVDRVLREVAAVLDRFNGQGRDGEAEVVETRLVSAWPPPSCAGARHVSERFEVVAAGADPVRGDRQRIVLAPSRVFGTGLHPSTRLAIRALEDLAGAGAGFPARVLDVGTGTGILAIVCARSGAGQVVGLDVCPESLEAARRNVELNGVCGIVEISGVPLAAVDGKFELVVANLTASVLSGLLRDMASLLRHGGTMVISGLQGRQFGEIAAELRQQGIVGAAAYQEGGWRAARCVKTV